MIIGQAGKKVAMVERWDRDIITCQVDQKVARVEKWDRDI